MSVLPRSRAVLVPFLALALVGPWADQLAAADGPVPGPRLALGGEADLTVDPVDSAQMAKAMALIETIQLRDQLRQQAEAGFDQNLASVQEQIAQLPAPMQKAFAEGTADAKKILAGIEWDGLLRDQAAAYARLFTADELVALDAFYHTPLGQRVVTQTPVVAKAQQDSMGKLMMGLMPRIQQVIMAKMDAAAGEAKGNDRANELAKFGIVVGQPFPALTGTDLAGKPFALADWKGKVVLVDFWASWCGPCVKELPNVQAAYARFHDQGFEVVGISLDEEKEALTAFLDEKKLPWPQLFDGLGVEGPIPTSHGVTKIPAAFLIGRDGVLVAADVRGPALAAAVEQALAVPASVPVPAP